MKKTIYLLSLFIAVTITSCKKDNSSTPSPTPTPTPTGPVNGDIYTIAGNGLKGFTGDGGAATSAELNNPNDIAVDAAGNIYIADLGNYRIRKINASGTISTIAGNGSYGNTGDGGLATAAAIGTPWGIAVDDSGNIYIASANIYSVRKINKSGIISTFAGNGTYGYSGDGGPATSAKLEYPISVAVDDSGNVYIVDADTYCIRKVNTHGIISTFAGNGSAVYTGDGVPATVAAIDPYAVAVDALRNVYIADQGNNRIRMVNSYGIITTIAGNGTGGFLGDGGAATTAEINQPNGVIVDGFGNVYISDYNNGRIRVINTNGIISTYAGTGIFGYTGDGGAATAAEISAAGIAADVYGNVYFVNDSVHVREVYK